MNKRRTQPHSPTSQLRSVWRSVEIKMLAEYQSLPHVHEEESNDANTSSSGDSVVTPQDKYQNLSTKSHTGPSGLNICLTALQTSFAIGWDQYCCIHHSFVEEILFLYSLAAPHFFSWELIALNL